MRSRQGSVLLGVFGNFMTFVFFLPSGVFMFLGLFLEPGGRPLLFLRPEDVPVNNSGLSSSGELGPDLTPTCFPDRSSWDSESRRGGRPRGLGDFFTFLGESSSSDDEEGLAEENPSGLSSGS